MKNILTLILVLLTFNLVTAAQTGKVLEFDGDEFHQVIFKNFYQDYTPENPHTLSDKFTVDVWVKQLEPGRFYPNGGYGLPSVGRSGTHAFLAGLFKSPADPTRYNVAGSIDTITQPCTATESYQVSNNFVTPYVFEKGVWTLVSYELYNGVLTVFKNGVPIFKKSGIVGDRIAGFCQSVDKASQDIYVGGSGNLMASQRIAGLRIFEGQSLNKGRGFVPQITFEPNYKTTGVNVIQANLLADFTNGGSYIADLSNGYKTGNGSLEIHSGFLNTSKNGGGVRRPNLSNPEWVDDNSFPLWSGSFPPSRLPEQGKLPSGTVVGDTFSRVDSNRFGPIGAVLGQTEVGKQIWTSELADAFAIVDGQVIYTRNNVYTSMLVDGGVSNGTVSVRRGLGNATGLRYRTANVTNGGLAFIQGDRLFVGSVTNGIASFNNAFISSSWDELKITMNGANVTATAGGGTVNWTDNNYQNATKAGLYVWTVTDSTLWAWDDFVIAQ